MNNQYFRSSWEANWARYLNWLKAAGQIKGWQFEPETFEFLEIKRGNRFYTPDFKVVENNDAIVYYEIKGWMDAQSKTKLRRMSLYFPQIKIIVIDVAAYAAVARFVGKNLPHWEFKTDKRRPLRVSPEQVRNGEALELVRRAFE